MKEVFTKIYNKAWAFLKSIYWFGLIIGILCGFVLMVAITNVMPLKGIIGSILGSMISAGVALFIFYRQSERQRKKEDLEKDQKEILIRKKVEYAEGEIKKTVSELETTAALFKYSGSGEWDQEMALSYVEKIKRRVRELEGYVNLAGVNDIDRIIDALNVLHEWEMNIDISITGGNLSIISNLCAGLLDDLK